MKRYAKPFSWFGVLLVALGLPHGAIAFSINTHELLNVKAAEQSFIDRYLKEQLGFPDGLQTQFDARKAFEWIRFGGAAEDEFLGIETLGAAFRSIHHFHNPLQAWDQAGLAGRCFRVIPVSAKASVRWAQDPAQGVSGQAAWADARKSFYQALTLPSKAERDDAWAKTFQILGQQMHLIADLAAPAHTRNDPHCRADGFEAWASENSRLVQDLLAVPPVPPDPTIFSLGVPIPDPIAMVPIARLWDSDQYNGTNPLITLGPTVGLAEYTNANFFSDDTVFSTDLPFPAKTSVELGPPEPAPKKGELRRYFRKIGDGELIEHLAVPSALYDFLPEALQDEKKGLDDKVFRDYGEKLLPRAVGYSAALLDYFFRESLQVEQMYWDSDGVFINVRNHAAEEAEGVFDLYAIYGRGTEGERLEKVVALHGGTSVKIGPGPHSGWRFRVDVPQDHRPTPDYALVFRGRLGHEEDAVVGHVFMVPHVIVVQEGYHADLDPDCHRTNRVTPFEYHPWPGTTYFRETARFDCEWKAVNHALSGRILTNSRSAIIERIEARWFEGLAPLIIGERTYAGAWQREGTEPDPESFSIADPAFRDRSGLALTIFLKGGERIETDLATFSSSRSSHVKYLVVHNPESGVKPDYLVTSGRGVGHPVEYNWYTDGLLQYPFFRATSISGYPNPTDTITDRWFHHFGFGEGVEVDSYMYWASAIDDFEAFPSDEKWPSTEDPAYQAAQQRFDAIEPLLDPQTHQGPFVAWQAEVARVYQPMEREFLRAVMTTDPHQFTILLSGTQR